MINRKDKSVPPAPPMTDPDTQRRADSQLSQRITDELDQQAEQIDSQVLSRLGRGRQAALDEYSRPHWFGLAAQRLATIRLAPALAVAATIVLALGLGWFGEPFRDSPTREVMYVVSSGELPGELTDMELLSATDEPELFADLEFYAWVGERFSDLDTPVAQPVDNASLPAG